MTSPLCAMFGRLGLSLLALAASPRVASAESAPLPPDGAQSAAEAQPAAPRKPLEEDAVLVRLVAESLAARPELERIRHQVRAERARAEQSAVWSDPMLQVGIQNDGFKSIEVGNMPTSYYSLMVSQTFPWPGKLGLRRQLGELAAAQTELAAARVKLGTEASVRRAYLALIVARDRQELLTRLAAVWERAARTAEARYGTGQGSQADVLRAELERTRLERRRLGLELEVRNAEQALNRLRGHPLSEPIETQSHVRDWSEPELGGAKSASSAARAQSPELAALRVSIAKAAHARQLVEKSGYPDLTVGAGIMYRGTSLPPMWQLTVGAPLPVFSGQRRTGAAHEARELGDAGRSASVEIEQLLDLRIAERRAALASLRASLASYERLLAQSGLTLESTLTQYVVGKVPFTAVLEANAGYLADQDEWLALRAQAEQLRIDDAEQSLEASALPTTGPTPTAAMGSASAQDNSSM